MLKNISTAALKIDRLWHERRARIYQDRAIQAQALADDIRKELYRRKYQSAPEPTTVKAA